MIIGVDTSHIKDKTGIAMVATINESFTEFFNKEQIIKDKNNYQCNLNISSFLEEAIEVYKKENNESPKGIIIYRQGFSLCEKEYLKTEVYKIDCVCN